MVFPATLVKTIFLQGSNYSDFLIFENVGLGEIKGHSLTTTLLSTTQFFSSLGFKLLIFTSFQECQFVSDQTSQSKNVVVSNFFGAMQVLGVSTLRKKVFAATLAKLFFSLGFKLLRFSCFLEYQFGRCQRLQFKRNRFFKLFLQLSNFREKVFGEINMPLSLGTGYFSKYPEYLPPNIQLKIRYQTATQYPLSTFSHPLRMLQPFISYRKD